VDQIVHDYGDLCQAVTELAIEHNLPITNNEFQTFNRCLDDAIANAVAFKFTRPHKVACLRLIFQGSRPGNCVARLPAGTVTTDAPCHSEDACRRTIPRRISMYRCAQI
jgi:hypothetical protein